MPTVLVTGANGFIGRFVVAALIRGGFKVVAAVRNSVAIPGVDRIVECDMARDVEAAVWVERLAGVDAVVNCAGVLRESGQSTFANVHERAPLALFEAAQQCGIKRVVQISSIGDPADGEFIASKHRCDEALAKLAIDWVVLRPSLVYSAEGSYGGTSLLRAIAAMPWLTPLPFGGTPEIQPIDAHDVGRAVVAALTEDAAAKQVIEVVGPAPISIAQYIAAWRAWLRLPPALAVKLPPGLTRLSGVIGQVFSRGPLGSTMTNMLAHGNVGSDNAEKRMKALLNIAPQSLESVLATRPSQTQDIVHARSYLASSIGRVLMAAVWIGSGVVGLWLPDERIKQLLAAFALPDAPWFYVARGGAVIDIVLGVMLLFSILPRFTLKAMIAVTLAYTVGLGVIAPEMWQDPFGALLKNLTILASALWLLASLDKRS